MTPSPFMTPGAGRVRAGVERRSALVILWLAHLPRLLTPAVLGAVFLAGLILPGVAGGLLLLITVAVMGLLSYLALPSVPVPLRVARLAVLLAVLVFALSKLV